MTSQKYSSDLRARAVRLVVDDGQGCAAVARALGVSESTVRRWVRQAASLDAPETAAPPATTVAPSSKTAAAPPSYLRNPLFWYIGVSLLLGMAGTFRQGPPRGTGAGASRPGTSALQGEGPTVRRPFARPLDDPATTNDESNDQPVGYFGSETVSVCSVRAGNCYTLDADVSGDSVTRIYFPRGGWVDFADCDLEDLEGECDDEEGSAWEFRGAQ
ncbi:MAG: transposase [Fimbriimonadaceae bacterium]|nr:transposase [Fimbriimonadaceae bacterium]